MARIGRKGRLWLRAFHIFFMALYVGGVISKVVILASTGSAQSDGGLQAMYQIFDALAIVNGMGIFFTFITGLLLAWLTPWGFFKHKWVIYTLAVVVFNLIIYFALGQPLESTPASLAEAEGLGALQNPEYISALTWSIIYEMVVWLLFISAAFVSVIKPWHKREAAEATS
jgi:uncharacterized membrane protein